MAALLHDTGLRLMECVRLRAKDPDLDRGFLMPAYVPRSRTRTRTRTRRDQAERLGIKRRAALGCPEAAVRQRQVMAGSVNSQRRPLADVRVRR